MMRVTWRRRLLRALAVSAAALSLAHGPTTAGDLPPGIALRSGTTGKMHASALLQTSIDCDTAGVGRTDAIESEEETIRVRAVDFGTSKLTSRLVGVLPESRSDIRAERERRLIPGGQSVGVAIETDGVIVVGTSDLGNRPSPARMAGIKMGDVITRVNGMRVDSAETLTGILEAGKTASVEYERSGSVRAADVVPEIDPRDGRCKLGAWVRDSTAGIGTLTYYDPETAVYGALGHAITDADTGARMPVGRGELFVNRVIDITPGAGGAPGELTGDFIFGAKPIGTVEINSGHGIFGRSVKPGAGVLYPDGLPVARREEIHTGAASLLTTIDGESVEEFECEIIRLNDRADAGQRAMVIRITDRSLLEKTGGIVQGMSGSPILQDGRLVGAVTHVMVNDPAMGYGVDIVTMLEEASVLSAAAEPAA